MLMWGHFDLEVLSLSVSPHARFVSLKIPNLNEHDMRLEDFV